MNNSINKSTILLIDDETDITDLFRIKAQLRRPKYNQKNVVIEPKLIKSGNITIDTDACCTYKDGNLLELTAREFNMLLYLMENQGKIISKERLYEQVWGEPSAVCDNTIMVHIRHLREKIEDHPSTPEKIITVKGLGYKFVKPAGNTQ